MVYGREYRNGVQNLSLDGKLGLLDHARSSL